jgi:hypothetical protein
MGWAMAAGSLALHIWANYRQQRHVLLNMFTALYSPKKSK